MSSASIPAALQKLRALLTRKEKMKWLGIVGFALVGSALEIVTASVIVVFAQVMNQPEMGQKYLSKLGFEQDLSAGRTVFWIALLVGAIYLIKNIVAAIEIFYQNFSIQKMGYHFKNKLLYRYAHGDYGCFLTRNSSFYSAVVGGEAEMMFSAGMTSLASIISESIVFCGLLCLVFYMNPKLALMILGIGSLLALGVVRILFPKFYQFGKRLQEASIYTGQNLAQFFHGFKEVILLGKRDTFIEAYKVHSYKKSKIQAMQTSLNGLPRMTIEVLFVGLFVTSIVFLCLEHETPVHMIGVMGGYLYVGFRLMPGLNRIVNQMNAFKSIIPYIERIYQEYTTVAAQEHYRDVPDFQFQKNIILTNLRFRYVNTKKDALICDSLEIRKGECIGIVGETGSGKSTLIDLLLGLLRPQEGTILVDGQYPVNSYQWHQKIGYVPQSVYLIDDTIAANITFGDKDINEKRLQEAVDAAQLRKFVDTLPNGVDTVVGERGVRLSGGERQRISIARALYRNPEVLIFDEATSALDHATEERLMETIHQVSQNRTVIMIAHRLTTLKDCGRIVVMKGGGVKEVQKYKDLVVSKDE